MRSFARDCGSTLTEPTRHATQANNAGRALITRSISCGGWENRQVSPADSPGPRRTWFPLITAVYGPTLLASIGFGAVIPMIALRAIELGAGAGLAAFITSLSGLATLAFDLPAGVIAARLGEKRSIVAACLTDVVIFGIVSVSHSLVLLGVCVFVHGMTGSVFGLARSTYLTTVLPLRHRARGMSSLGGVFRVGWFIGPLASSAIIARGEIQHAFIFAAIMSLTAALVTLATKDLPGEQNPSDKNASAKPRTLHVLRTHRHSLLTIGLGCLALMVIRSSRQTVIPLWAEASGLSASTTSLIYAISMSFDILLFFPGGAIMDRFGRWFVCVPSMFVMSVGVLVLPLTHTQLAITLVACLIGLGNGVSSGIVLTLGADTAPRFGRTQFLAGWRMLADTGSALGPLMISLASTIAGLGAAALVVGSFGILGVAWLSRWVPRTPEQLATLAPDD
ncbi:hypothetical protein HMPREF1531_00104 [Propionibacterium sp. oral taxon 192 str. F0372]|nr:hypothetical protein HMPREF1531_00104 [Propionibacterium sp. oral taxon 192 str. F0372]